jgi:hypothetical protein
MGDEVTRREAITKLAATAGVGTLLAAAASEARGRTPSTTRRAAMTFTSSGV